MNLRKKALEYAQASYSPYSKAKVGSAIETEDGTIFGGCNIENSSFGGTVCAERVAIWKAVSEGHKKIRRVYVYTDEGWPPCGLCRQVMAEFATEDLEVIISNKKGDESTHLFKELMPLAFTPEHLIK
jgi:cytidine deaminase